MFLFMYVLGIVTKWNEGPLVKTASKPPLQSAATPSVIAAEIFVDPCFQESAPVITERMPGELLL
jgi:hypothetical protein